MIETAGEMARERFELRTWTTLTTSAVFKGMGSKITDTAIIKSTRLSYRTDQSKSEVVASGRSLTIKYSTVGWIIVRRVVRILAKRDMEGRWWRVERRIRLYSLEYFLFGSFVNGAYPAWSDAGGRPRGPDSSTIWLQQLRSVRHSKVLVEPNISVK